METTIIPCSKYIDIDNADPIMGMYAETHLPGGVLGETMHALLSDQYLRLRDGDLFILRMMKNCSRTLQTSQNLISLK